MNNDKRSQPAQPWARRPPDATRPTRNAGGFYRTAEVADGRYGGVPLTTANDALVAAVRLAYKVADDQVDRSIRLARRLRDAGDRAAGPRSDRKTLDATEKLVMKTLMSGLEWWEASVAEGRCPIKRLVAAEYQMLGSMMGLGPAPRGDRTRSTSPAAPAWDAQPMVGAAASQPCSKTPNMIVVHDSLPTNRRPVLVRAWHVSSASAIEAEVYFHNAGDASQPPFAARFSTGGPESDARLTLTTSSQASGMWRAAICDQNSVQIGTIEIEF